MLDIIKKAIFQYYKAEDIIWLFLSTFDKNGILGKSNGVLEADKPLNQLIDLLYHGLLEKEKNVATLVADIVTESREEKNMQTLMQLSTQEYGVCLISEDNSNNSWVILPNTQWITTMVEWLQVIKQKYGLTWKVSIYIFKTQRIVIPV